MIPFDTACEALRATLAVDPDALERAEMILEMQHASLSAEPPARSLPDAALVAARARLRSGDPVIPRERWPVETRRVARLLRFMGGRLLPESILELAAVDFTESALPAAQGDDGRGVLKAAERLGLPAEACAALLRESLKPEMLRTSLPFASLVGDVPRPARCPMCGDRPAAATASHDACCRWCGTIWRWDGRGCASCGRATLVPREIARLARGATLLQCTSCGDAMRLFAVPADALLLSLLAILTAPIDLALRVQAEATPHAGFDVF